MWVHRVGSETIHSTGMFISGYTVCKLSIPIAEKKQLHMMYECTNKKSRYLDRDPVGYAFIWVHGIGSRGIKEKSRV